MKLSLLVAALAAVTGCGGAVQKPPVDAGSSFPISGCDRDSLEADFGTNGPMTGSGVSDAGVLQPPPAGTTSPAGRRSAP